MSSNLPALSLGVCRAASRKAPLCPRARLWEHGVCRDGNRTTKRSCFVLGYCRGRQRLWGCAEKRKGGEGYMSAVTLFSSPTWSIKHKYVGVLRGPPTYFRHTYCYRF